MPSTPANALDITQAGIVNFDGVSNFTGVTVTQHDLLIGAASNGITSVTPGTSGGLLASAGVSSDPAFTQSPSVTGSITAGTSLTATSGAITATAGNVVITAGNLTLPNTNAGATNGAISLGGAVFLSNFGMANVFLGTTTGNTTNTGTANVAIGQDLLTALTIGGQNTAIGQGALVAITSGSDNIGLGYQSIQSVSTNSGNIGIGYQSLASTTGSNNVAIGYGAASGTTGTASDNVFIGTSCGQAVTNGQYNVAIGENSLVGITAGTRNVSIGYFALPSVTTGANNIAIGQSAGFNNTTSDSNNVYLQHFGISGESNVMRLGAQGSGTSQVNTCYIAGISGVTVTGTAVLCSASGQLGTIASSERYKENIRDISPNLSILNLKPRSFNYKADLAKTIQYGLVAEEVHNDFPYLCFYNENGKPESVKYHEMATLLLNEIQKLNLRISELENR